MLTENERMHTALIGRKRRRLGGQTLIEFTLALPLLLLTLFGVLNTGWLIYRTVTLQFAVREGCRYGITNQKLSLNDSGGKNYGLIEWDFWVLKPRMLAITPSTFVSTILQAA
jgi:Flp pilus assembly protein TadG